jgi:hypothetical protein
MHENRSPANNQATSALFRVVFFRCVASLAVAAILLSGILSVPEYARGTTAPGEQKERGEKGETKEKKHEAQAGPEKLPPPAVETDERSPVLLAGQVSEDSAGPSGVIRFWLTVENRSSQNIANVQLTHPQIPGFRLTRLCWPGAAENHCEEVANDEDAGEVEPAKPSAARHLLQGALQPQQSVTVWGYLEAVKTTPRQNTFLTVSWDGPGHSSETIGLGDIESLSHLRALFLLFSNRWEWSFPIALSILTLLGRWWLKSREKTREARAEELSYQQRTWSLMLKQAQNVGLKYYTPLSGSLLALRDELELYLVARDANILAEACYDLMMFQRRLREALDAVGGYYFKNRNAESLADLLYQKHRVLLNFDAPLRKQFSAAGVNMQPTTTWARFSELMHSPASHIHPFWLAFQAHMATVPHADLEREIRVLDAYAALLEYEVNRPLLYWYGKLRPIQFKFVDVKADPSRNVFLEWKSWQAKMQLSPAQVADYEIWGANYLKDAERDVSVEPKKKSWWRGIGN